MLVFSASVGVYYHFAGGRQKTSKEYFLANKNMPIIPVAFSLMASFMSAITILGLAAENYINGSQFVIINIAYIIGTPIAAYVFLPVFYQMQATSAFEGGMKAVLWTDLFQSLLMFSAVFAVIAKGTIDVGGFSEVWRLADEGKRIEFFKALFLNWPLTSLLSLTASFAGIVVYANLAKCDPILRSEETHIEKADQGSVIGFLVSLCLCFWLCFRKFYCVLKYIFPLLKLSYMWYAGFGYIVCIVVGYSTSLICGKRRYVNPVLLSPFVQSKSSIKEPISEVLQLDECT
ncbi:putative sodium-dependent multivitamin like protein [Argiope bruennichi]|uniref:Putative sodium-dependent multivitamin like protein n=1 Tax=Argiope bruennichi TaxID=94029 RepID=A0A8T0FCQ1_ARGBR|nr:putative sodium-dependent multivitamin like protein [Argiope bruennichi]